MRLTVVLIALLGCLAVVAARTDSVRSSMAMGDGKKQPKEVTLLQDSKDDKWGEVAFNHENHSTKKYSPDGTAVLTCVECHHTDQPVSALKGLYKTGERDVVLTTAVLDKPDSKPVKTCRACHLQKGDDSAPIPEITYPNETDPTPLNNKVANHKNCEDCHDKAIEARPALKGKLPGSGGNDCGLCHKAL
jgi:hypothetical protein